MQNKIINLFIAPFETDRQVWTERVGNYEVFDVVGNERNLMEVIKKKTYHEDF